MSVAGAASASVRSDQRWPGRVSEWFWGIYPTVIWTSSILAIPIGILILTGGIGNILTWIYALILIPVSFFGAASVGWVWLAYALAAVVGLLLDHFFSRLFLSVWLTSGVICSGAVFFYITRADLNTSNLRLPVSPDNLGVLVVIVGSTVVLWLTLQIVEWSGLAMIGQARTKPSRTPSVQLSRSVAARKVATTPVEPSDTFWSVEPVVAWRAWTWSGRDLEGMRVSWTTTELDAWCKDCDVVPSWDHTCGIYAVNQLADIPRFLGSRVIGKVELWGDVIEHEEGYRASNARIVELWADPALADAIQRRYPDVVVHPGYPSNLAEEP